VDSRFSNIKDRISFKKLVETNKMLTTTLIDNTKRQRTNNLEILAAIPPGLGNTGSSILSLPPLSRSDFPHIKFWTREEWDNHKSHLKDASGSKGKGPECTSRHLNITAPYMETEDGTPVSGPTIGQMQVVACIRKT